MLQVLAEIPKSGRTCQGDKDWAQVCLFIEWQTCETITAHRKHKWINSWQWDICQKTPFICKFNWISYDLFFFQLNSLEFSVTKAHYKPIGKPQGCLFDNGTFSLVRSAFAAPFVTSSPKIKQTNQQKNETKTKVVVEYPSKTVNKTLSGEMEPIVKALAHGPPSRIAKTVLKCKTLRTEIISQVLRVVASEMNELCSKKNPSILRKTSKDDLINFDMKHYFATNGKNAHQSFTRAHFC